MNDHSSRTDALREMREPVIDHDCQSELAALIGQAKVLELLTRLADDLHTRLRSLEPDALRADAHSIVSTAGLLGFAGLSAAALRLEHAIEGGDDVAVLLPQLLMERSAAISAIAEASGLVDKKSDLESAQ